MLAENKTLVEVQTTQAAPGVFEGIKALRKVRRREKVLDWLWKVDDQPASSPSHYHENEGLDTTAMHQFSSITDPVHLRLFTNYEVKRHQDITEQY